ncbi:hypothetical protein H744_1c1506 [Photobacterium gaetbulicola Gung47]|uniref:Uncharacterized protein n=1 Tax=Photobacterium gaetbulicola Gung47 TaxID=658445 RepID=A0A0C5WHB4_9GAMM|nr:hypothetical protein H744_1c1506 [Photobacterium gaetbulicola Gung47]
MAETGHGQRFTNVVHHHHAACDFTEHRITPALVGGSSEIKKVVVFQVDEKLRCRRMWRIGTSHCNRARFVFQAAVGFVDNRVTGQLFLHSRLVATALDHKTVNHTVENRSFVKAVFAVLQKVLRADRSLVEIQFDFDITEVRRENNHKNNFAKYEWLAVYKA